ncbi:MAG: hypothetical protein IJD28_06620 [Deferribacterales bacterium]|nr:hypothetical protein [Deferribacterales bacterium]
MEIKKIKTEAEYTKALLRIEQLMFNVLPHSKEGEELEALSKMVADYENENFLYVDDGGKPRKRK